MKSGAVPVAVLIISFLILASGFWMEPVSSAAPKPAVPASFFGITVTSTVTTWPVPLPFGTAGKTAAGGPPGGTYWLSLEPSNGSFDWAPLDNLVRAARAAGVADVTYTLYETPNWASSAPNQACFATQNFGIVGCAAPPKHMSDWDAFVTALATRYKGQIQYYELWNEPNVQTEYSGNVSEMISMAQHAYGIVKSIDPSALVLTPGVSVAGIAPYTPGCSPSTCWLAQYLQAGGGKYADGVAFHGKTCLSDNQVCDQEGIGCSSAEIEACAGTGLVSQIKALRSLMETYGMAGKPLVDTEGGYSDEVGLKSLFGSADQQAAFVSRFFILQASENLSSAVWFSWLMNRKTGLMGLGTAAAETETNQSYMQTHEWLLGSTFGGPCSLSGGVWACSLSNSVGDNELLAWADTNSSASSYLPAFQVAEYQDLKGATHVVNSGQAVPIDEGPILLEGGPSSTSNSTTAAASGSTSSSPLHSTSSRSATSTNTHRSSSEGGGIPGSVNGDLLLALGLVAAVVVALGLAAVVRGRRFRRGRPSVGAMLISRLAVRRGG